MKDEWIKATTIEDWAKGIRFRWINRAKKREVVRHEYAGEDEYVISEGAHHCSMRAPTGMPMHVACPVLDRMLDCYLEQHAIPQRRARHRSKREARA